MKPLKRKTKQEKMDAEARTRIIASLNDFFSDLNEVSNDTGYSIPDLHYNNCQFFIVHCAMNRRNTMLKNLSNWYDSLQEPYRFAVFAYFVFGSGLPFGIAMLSYNAGIQVMPAVFATLGVLHLVFFYTFAIYRATRK